jgi:hypothetical protein
MKTVIVLAMYGVPPNDFPRQAQKHLTGIQLSAGKRVFTGGL